MPELVANSGLVDVVSEASLVDDWLGLFSLSAAEVDCATAVMLKILDGKCKMVAAEKPVMASLYMAVREQPGIVLGEAIHRRIDAALQQSALDEATRMEIYETRVLAESAISRPVMKAFKARLRASGLLPAKQAA